MSCDRHYGIAGYPDCSGHGRCVSGFCVCDAGWSSVGDYELEEGIDCDNYLPGIRIIAIANVVVLFFVLIHEISVIYSMLRKKRPNKGKIINATTCLLTTIFSFVYSTLKLIDPEKYILGTSIGMALAHSMYLSSGFGMGATYTLLSIKFLEGNSRRLGSDARIHFRNNIMHWKLIMTVCPYVFFVVSITTQIVGMQFSISYSDIICTTMSAIHLPAYTLNLLCIRNVGKKFTDEINNFLTQIETHSANADAQNLQYGQTSKDINNFAKHSPANDDIIRIIKTSSLINTLLFRYIFSGFVVFFVGCVWYFFRRKSTYIILMLMFIINIRIPVYLRSIQTFSKPLEVPKSSKSSKFSTNSSKMSSSLSALLFTPRSGKPASFRKTNRIVVEPRFDNASSRGNHSMRLVLPKKHDVKPDSSMHEV